MLNNQSVDSKIVWAYKVFTLLTTVFLAKTNSFIILSQSTIQKLQDFSHSFGMTREIGHYPKFRSSAILTTTFL